MKALITYAQGVDVDYAVTSKGGTVLYKYNIPGMFLVEAELPDAPPIESGAGLAASYADAASALRAMVGILSVEETTPNDVSIAEIGTLDLKTSDYSKSWGVSHIGGREAHVAGHIGEGVKLAVVDTGIATHEDLVITGGFNATDPSNPSFDDDHSHGTHCSGIAAAQNNGTGVVGVAPGVQLYGVKVLRANGSGSYSDIIRGIEWTVANNMDVSSHSYGGSGTPPLAYTQAFKAATDHHVVVCAAGNRGGSGADTMLWPARFPETIAVGSIADERNLRSSFSSTGPLLDIMAPGSAVYSTIPSGYGLKSGTSMACPHVAGAAALALGSGVPKDQVRQRLTETAKDLGVPGHDNLFGHGLVDLIKMLNLEIIPRFGPQVKIWTGKSTDDGEIVNRLIRTGDGRELNLGITPNIILTYPVDGFYTPEAILTDNDGMQGRAAQRIEIAGNDSSPPPPPEPPPPPPPGQTPPTVVIEVTNEGDPPPPRKPDGPIPPPLPDDPNKLGWLAGPQVADIKRMMDTVGFVPLNAQGEFPMAIYVSPDGPDGTAPQPTPLAVTWHWNDNTGHIDVIPEGTWDPIARFTYKQTGFIRLQVVVGADQPTVDTLDIVFR